MAKHLKHGQSVDSGITSLLKAIENTRCIHTIASCEGRPFSIAPRMPYVYFRCAPELAEKIASSLYSLCAVEDRTYYDWHLLGLFHPELGLCFHLSMTKQYFCRHRVNADVDLLCKLVSEVATASAGVDLNSRSNSARQCGSCGVR